ncbi:hypothetical protein [Ponticoccus alexandrii]|uniref:hypothetical protein n=1 Tax=Ponticoccus alexandrii TaxID=1943633 RepID=UPI00203A47EF|nr:hypothetical protein [Ponticoccus alexandrii]
MAMEQLNFALFNLWQLILCGKCEGVRLLNEQIKISNRRLWMHKGVNIADFSAEHVLTNNHWLYVELWLKRKFLNREPFFLAAGSTFC